MKIFFIQKAMMMDHILRKDKKQIAGMRSQDIIMKYVDYGFISQFGIDKSLLFQAQDPKIHIAACVESSKYLQTQWATEQGLRYNSRHWQKEILAAQLEQFQPDVIYTVNHVLFDKEMKQYLPKAKLYVLWNASVMRRGVNLSHFDVGISFNQVYLDTMRKNGVKNLEHNTFYVDPTIKQRLMDVEQDIDIVFAGRYNNRQFKHRNQFLYDVYKNFKQYNVQYFLLTHKIKRLIPTVPLKMLRAYNPPVFFENMFRVFRRAKIVLNTHSKITGEHKGNMRVFEALGSGSFMLSDAGIYPQHLKAGEDFITYSGKKDMIDKIAYYLKNDTERMEIAENGYKKVARYYTPEIGTQNLAQIFSKYIGE